MEQTALVVPGMNSRECERAVTTTLVNEPGVFWATADASAGLASIQYDRERADIDVLRGVLRASGYLPTLPGVE